MNILNINQKYGLYFQNYGEKQRHILTNRSSGPAESCDPFRYRPEQREGMTIFITFQHSNMAYVKRVPVVVLWTPCGELRVLRMSFFIEIDY